ncbi:predicted protein [Nematostella vectensis]|uniref:PID domain-containing protein n=1 Tax=Nematostella vectensis TaxID=45351 RepID=A7RGL0_NEMVE|nr:low density lipoprotein receptor adapter protein 1-B [Nematostella vectensis]EDO49442.1 predicted protein [Nematostella vectensis]|eukprot:XP_001641505.1 predicted protein [Nematostella vectensis]
MLKLFSCRSDSSATIESDKDYLTVDFSKHRPTYTVRYLGCEELYKPGLQQMCETVNDIYVSQKSRLRKLNHCFLTVTSDAVILREQDSTEDDGRTFHLRRILYCGVYSRVQRLFFFNYQSGAKGDVVNCHIILCSSKEEAKSLAKVLSKAFKLAAIEAHHQDVENRKLHARGLSQSSLAHETDGRKYYNMKNSGGNLSVNSADFRMKGLSASSDERDFRSGKGSNNKFSDWEITDSSRDDTSMSSFTAEIRDLIETSSYTKDTDFDEETSSLLKSQTDATDDTMTSDEHCRTQEPSFIRFSYNFEIDNWSKIIDLDSTDV